MHAYVYKAALWCPTCGLAHRTRLPIPPGADANDESTWDSDVWPKGPYAEGGGEADSPQHCEGCGVFLENPVTDNGLDALYDAHAEGKQLPPAWIDFYDLGEASLAEPRDPGAIAAANDHFRKTATSGVVFTRALAELCAEQPSGGFMAMLAIRQQVAAFDAFTPANDPHGEHDFAAFDYRFPNGRTERLNWKIDVYADATLTAGAEDPLSPTAVRILTIMLASDY